jgi:hypothetical protein
LRAEEREIASDDERGTFVSSLSECSATFRDGNERSLTKLLLPRPREARHARAHFDGRLDNAEKDLRGSLGECDAANNEARLVAPHAPAPSSGEQHRRD